MMERYMILIRTDGTAMMVSGVLLCLPAAELWK